MEVTNGDGFDDQINRWISDAVLVYVGFSSFAKTTSPYYTSDLPFHANYTMSNPGT